jgi:hypothetical protein
MGSILIGNFVEDTKITPCIISLNADNQTLTGTGVDMLGYQGVVFIAVALHGENMTYGLKAQQDTDVAFGGAQDLLGSNVVFTTTTVVKGQAALEIHNPKERYVRPLLVVPNVTTPNAVCVIAIQYGKDWRPITNTNTEFHEAPAEGTA